MWRGSNRKDGEKSQKWRERVTVKWRIILERRSTKKGRRMVERRVMVRLGYWGEEEYKNKWGRRVGKKWLTWHKKRLSNLIANPRLLYESNS